MNIKVGDILKSKTGYKDLKVIAILDNLIAVEGEQEVFKIGADGISLPEKVEWYSKSTLQKFEYGVQK